ncbi:MAG TPA: GDP-mannose 4,6-dehydratase [Victivallales bacterium]|nr:GDP-mannose 4,6-dehydratase [Victivallales bacterium]HPO89992.1 GDP-mannose 4,6-dehydratase [Victivallales bacterium]HRR27746.1 GDP-mannose 4,6-dehydratase [Victivallales bacterium]
MNKTIVITGTAGFIGFHLAKKLLLEGFNVIGIDNFNDYYNPKVKEARSKILRDCQNFKEFRINIEDFEAIQKVFDSFSVEVVCHLAAQAGVRYSLINPFAYEKSNISAFLNILEIVRHKKIKRLVYASSSSVYGGLTKLPFSEKDRVDTPISLYAATKKANELMAHCYSHLYGIQTIGLRFFTVYGPWGRPDMAMWIFASAISKGRKIQVFNNGKMKRDFTYIDDIIDGTCSAIFAEGLGQYEVFNLGNHRSEEIMDMIKIIENELGKKAEIEFLPLQPGDVPETYADISNAQKKLSFSPKIPISKGIPKFISWFKGHPEIVQ